MIDVPAIPETSGWSKGERSLPDEASEATRFANAGDRLGEVEDPARMRIRPQEENRVVKPDQAVGVTDLGAASLPENPRGRVRPRTVALRLVEGLEKPLVHGLWRERTASTADRVGSISIGRLARAGAGSRSR